MKIYNIKGNEVGQICDICDSNEEELYKCSICDQEICFECMEFHLPIIDNILYQANIRRVPFCSLLIKNKEKIATNIICENCFEKIEKRYSLGEAVKAEVERQLNESFNKLSKTIIKLDADIMNKFKKSFLKEKESNNE